MEGVSGRIANLGLGCLVEGVAAAVSAAVVAVGAMVFAVNASGAEEQAVADLASVYGGPSAKVAGVDAVPDVEHADEAFRAELALEDGLGATLDLICVVPLGYQVGHLELGAPDGFRKHGFAFLAGLAAFEQGYGVGSFRGPLPVYLNCHGFVPGEPFRECLPVVKMAGLGAETAVRPHGHEFPDHLVLQVHYRDVLGVRLLADA